LTNILSGDCMQLLACKVCGKNIDTTDSNKIKF